MNTVSTSPPVPLSASSHPLDLVNMAPMASMSVSPQDTPPPKPDSISFEEAASCWMQYITAYGGLIEAGKLKKGDTALITAASSSVGLAAIEIIRNHGATPIATTLNNQMKDAVLKLSRQQHEADAAPKIIAITEQDFEVTLRDILGTDRLNVVFDAVGGKDVETFAAYMANNGIIVSHGRLAPGITPFPIQYAIRGSLTMRGYVFTEIVSDEVKLEAAKTYILQGLIAGTLKPVISKTFPFEQIVEAHEYLESNQQIGKIVITIS